MREVSQPALGPEMSCRTGYARSSTGDLSISIVNGRPCFTSMARISPSPIFLMVSSSSNDRLLQPEIWQTCLVSGSVMAAHFEHLHHTGLRVETRQALTDSERLDPPEIGLLKKLD